MSTGDSGPLLRVQFGPRERRGILGFASTIQVLATVTILGFSTIFLAVMPNIYGVFVFTFMIGVGVTITYGTWHGRTFGALLWQNVSFRLRKARGRLKWRSTAPSAGIHLDGREVAIPLPDNLGRVEILTFSLLEWGELGVIADRDDGTYTAALQCHPDSSFVLADEAEQLRLMETWTNALALFGQEQSPIDRVAWIERTVPGDPDALMTWFKNKGDQRYKGSEMAKAYEGLISDVGPATVEHELFLVVRLNTRKAASAISAEAKTLAWKKSGLSKGDYNSCAVLLRCMQAFAGRLNSAEIGVDYLLGPRRLAAVTRTAFEPSARVKMSALHHANPELELGTSPRNAWPVQTVTDGECYQTDSDAYSRTFWVRQWPREERGIGFLAPLLMEVGARRAICVIMEPLPYSKAMKEAKMAVTADKAESMSRARYGFDETAERRRQLDASAVTEEELADGNVDMRFAGFVTVTSKSLEALREDCDEVVAAAQASGLELDSCNMEQDKAFTLTLPMGRGIKKKS